MKKLYSDMAAALLEEEAPSAFFRELQQKGELGETFPELFATIGVPQNPKYHAEGDVFTHTMMVLDAAAGFRERAKSPLGFMLAALCHDLGKPLCTEEINGVIHAYRHETLGLPEAERLLRRFCEDEELIRYVLNLVEFHMKPNVIAAARSTPKATNRMFHGSSDPEALIYLGICDGLGKLPIHDSPKEQEFLWGRLRNYRELMARPMVTEDDLFAAGVPEESHEELLRYAEKLHLAGEPKERVLRSTLAMARKKRYI